MHLLPQHNLLDRGSSERIQASVRASAYSCFAEPRAFMLCSRTQTRHTCCSFLFSEHFRFRLHIFKVSIPRWPLATVGTFPHPPRCNLCPAREWRHWKNPSVCHHWAYSCFLYRANMYALFQNTKTSLWLFFFWCPQKLRFVLWFQMTGFFVT